MNLFRKLFKSKKEVSYPDVSEGMKGILLKGIGMHWAYGCKPLVEEALSQVDGIQSYAVIAPPQDQAFVVFNPEKTDVNRIKQAITESGYGVKRVIEKE